MQNFDNGRFSVYSWKYSAAARNTCRVKEIVYLNSITAYLVKSKNLKIGEKCANWLIAMAKYSIINVIGKNKWASSTTEKTTRYKRLIHLNAIRSHHPFVCSQITNYYTNLAKRQWTCCYCKSLFNQINIIHTFSIYNNFHYITLLK
jgi:hypothetical protein